MGGLLAIFAVLQCHLVSSFGSLPILALFATDSHNPSSPTACRSARLASWLISSLSQLWASGKRIKNSYTSPAKRRRGGPASSPAPATASPGLVSPAVSPSIFIPQTNHPTNFPASFILFMDSLQRSTSSLTHLLCDFAAISATSAFPLSLSIVAACSPAPPTNVRPC
ncbi:hypothetical protein CRENBAI_002516 [Crenichthys baileyi]|uniref:Secreted protein n=1 Tax=Crenichthys baileyi TaxID=28760 RepID=A0AAV9QQI5_9TELE